MNEQKTNWDFINPVYDCEGNVPFVGLDYLEDYPLMTDCPTPIISSSSIDLFDGIPGSPSCSNTLKDSSTKDNTWHEKAYSRIQGRSRRKRAAKPVEMATRRICSGCFTESTPQWRKGPNSELLCNACGLQAQKAFLEVKGLKRKTEPSLLKPKGTEDFNKKCKLEHQGDLSTEEELYTTKSEK